jgi:glyoxylase-like metal-dependent hydrolase (beta-lactamase superfamily II)
VAGDLFLTTTFPVIDLDLGGGIDGFIEGLNLMLDITVPAHLQDGGTYVIPGHGRVSDEADVVEYRDMVYIVRDRIRDMISRGMTLEAVLQAFPALDYTPRYDDGGGSWTTEMFVEAAYRSLSADREQVR